jgi:hypothetical protein
MFIPDSPPPRQEGMSAKFHHSTILKELFDVSVEAKLKKWPKYSHFLKENFCIFKNIQIFALYCRENSKTNPRWPLN